MTPVLVLLVVFVLWAGRGGRAGLVTDLAAGEAATVAALYSDNKADAPERERVVEQILSARPGLELLCIGGPQPRALGSSGGFVDEAWVTSFEPEIPGAARGVGALGVRLECETDGAVAPLLGWFPTVSFLGQASEVITIAPRPKAGASAEPVLEGNDPDNRRTLKFVVGFDAAANQDVEISFKTIGAGTVHDALAGWDYEPVMATTLTIPEGESTADVEVVIIPDTIYEHDETLALEWSMTPTDPCAADVPALANPKHSNAVIQCDPALDYFGMPVDPVTGVHVPGFWQAQDAIGTILNDDNPPTLTVDDASAGESAGTLTFEPQIVGPTGRAVTFKYRTADDTATSGSDYQTVPQTDGTIPADETRGADDVAQTLIPVTIIPDNVGEGDETLTLEITDVVDASPTMLEATGTITDDEPRITITASPDTVIEGETLNFNITVNPVPTTAGGTVDVVYTIGPSGTNPAREGSDYFIQTPHTTTDTLSFDPGSFPTQTITVSANDDGVYEGTDETLEVSLSNPSMNASLGVSTATGTIQDLQTNPWITVGDAQATEGSSLQFPVEIGGPTAYPVTVNYRTDPATDVDPLNQATAVDDYTPTSPSGSSITIPAGQTQGTIEIVTPPDDGKGEQDEIFYLRITSANNANVANPESRQQAIGTITDSDQTSRFLVADSSGDPNDGYDAATMEGDDLTFTIHLTRAPTDTVSVDYTLFDIAGPPGGFQAATAGDDYAPVPAGQPVNVPGFPTGTVEFLSGETTKTVTVRTLTDYQPEGTEVFRLQLSKPSPGTSLGSRAVGIGAILNVTAPALSAVGARADEGDDLTFAVEISVPQTQDVEFEFRTWPGTATERPPGTALGGDYQGQSWTSLIMPASQDRVEVNVDTFSDTELENPETLQFQIRIVDPSLGVGISTPSATGTIADVVPVLLSVFGADAVEGQPLGFRITLNTRVAHKVTVVYATQSGTALAGADYDETSDTLVFEPRQEAKIISVQTLRDEVHGETIETLYLRLGDAKGAALVLTQAEGRIFPAAQARIHVADARDEEGDPLEFRVTARDGPANGTVGVKYTTAPFNSSQFPATAGSDYVTAQGAIEIALDDRGIGSGAIVVDTVGETDNQDDGPYEEFRLDLNTLSDALFDRATATGRIDEPCLNPFDAAANPPGVDPIDITLPETTVGLFSAGFSIASPLCLRPSVPAVAHTTAEGTAGAGADYTAPPPGTVPIGWGSIEIPGFAIIDDDLDEPDETFTVVIGNWASSPALAPSFYDPSTVGPELATATVTIEDDDPQPTLIFRNAHATEGSDLSFPVILDRPSGRPITFNYETRPLSEPDAATEGPDPDTPGADYTYTRGTLTIRAGDITATIVVPTRTDTDLEGPEQLQLVISDANYTTVLDPIADGTISDPAQIFLRIASEYSHNGIKEEEGGRAGYWVDLFGPQATSFRQTHRTRDLNTTDAATVWADYAYLDAFNDFKLFDFRTGDAFRVRYSSAISIYEDDIVEDDERFLFEITGVDDPNIVIADPIAEGVIAGQCIQPLQTDVAPPALTIGDIEIEEGTGGSSEAVFSLTIDTPFCLTSFGCGGLAICPQLINQIRVEVEPRHGTTSDDDWEAPEQFAVFHGGDLSTEYRMFVHGDDAPEDDEIFEIAATWHDALKGTYSDDLNSQFLNALEIVATATIRDDDDNILISIGPASALEGDELSFPVRLDRPAEREVEVSYTTIALSGAADAATPGDDYTTTSGTLTIGVGETGGVIPVPTHTDDDYDEGDERLRVQLSNPVPLNYTFIDPSSAVGTISNVVPPQIRVSSAEADEGETLVFEVTLLTPGDQPVAVEYASGGGTASQGLDYLRAAGVLRFDSGETLKTIEVAASADGDRENDEHFFITLSHPVGAVIADPTGRGTIINLDPPAITVGDRRVVEGSPAIFEVALSSRASRAITVDFATVSHAAPGALVATTGADFTAASGSIVIPAGSTSATVAVATTEDQIDEYDETFRFVLSDPDYGDLGDPVAAGTITDDDPLPTLSTAGAFAAEDSGTITATVILSEPSGRSGAVEYTTVDGTAVAPDDYTAAAGTLLIPAGQTTASIDISLDDDDDDEGPETLTLSLSSPQNASLANSSALFTIIDDEGLPTAFLVPRSSGAQEGAPAEITVRLSRPAAAALSVDYTTTDGTAVAPGDYTAASATQAFAVGDTEHTLSTPTMDDDKVEDTEAFTWLLSNPSGVLFTAQPGTSQIIDDDNLPDLTVDDTLIAEGGGPLQFTVQLSGPAVTEVTAAWQTERNPFAHVAAAPGQDYSQVSGTISIAIGARTATVEVPIIDDSLDEDPETLWLRLSNVTGADIADAVAVGTIADDDPEPHLIVGDAAAAEGSRARFPVHLSEPSGRTVRLRYAPYPITTADHPADPVDDYNPATGSLSIPPGTTLTHAEVQLTTDHISEYSETFTVRIFNPVHATVAVSAAVGTIIDGNGPPAAAISGTEADENRGPAILTVTLTHPSTQTTSLRYATVPVTAKTPDDYTTTSGTLTFPPNATEATVAVTLNDDSTAELDEYFTVTLSHPTGVVIFDPSASVVIRDDDGLPRFSVAPATADENDPGATFSVTLSHPSDQAATIQYATFDNTAQHPDDYTAASGTLTLPPNATEAVITVPIVNDRFDEHDEQFTLRLSNPTGAGLSGPVATASIIDDDPEPRLRLLPASAQEGDSLRFAAVLEAPSGRTVTADYTTAADPAGAHRATSGADYTATAGAIAFMPGETLRTISVETADDALTEAPETLQLRLSNPSGAALTPADATGTGTISNRRLPAVTVANAAAFEGDPVVFTINLDRPATGDVSISYEPIAATANSLDFRWSSQPPLLIPAGQTLATVAISTVADDVVEGDEQFLLRLTGLTGNAQIELATAVGTIFENPLIPSLSVGDAQATEGGALSFTVTLSRPISTADSPVTVDFDTRPLTATAGADYAPRQGSLSFPASTVDQTRIITVDTVPDTLPEDAETTRLVLSNPRGATISDQAGTGTILDDDLEPALSTQSAEADEGSPLVFTATLNAPSSRIVTAGFQVTAGTATAGADYISPAGQTIVFPIGATRQAIAIETLPDSIVEEDETLALTLSNPQGATLATTTSTGTIIDSTRPSLRIAPATAHEGEPLQFGVTLNRQSDSPITASYNITSVTARSGTDYTAPTDRTITFPAGITRQTIAIETLADDDDEAEETLEVTLSNPTSGSRILTGTATGTIRDTPRPLISVSDAAGTESSDQSINFINFKIRLSRPSTEAVTVDWWARPHYGNHRPATVGPEVAIEGVDYLKADGTATFRPGVTAIEIEVAVIPDRLYELNETFGLVLRRARNADLDPDASEAIGTIYNDEPLPVIGGGIFQKQEGPNPDLPNLGNDNYLYIETSRKSGLDTTVQWALVGRSHRDDIPAATEGDDFVAASGTATIPAGSSRAQFTELQLIDDDVWEETEALTVVFSNPVNATLFNPFQLGNVPYVVNIGDNEQYLQGFRGVAAAEGNDVVFTVYRRFRTVPLPPITYQTVDGTAQAGDDYTGVSGTLTFEDGQKQTTITVATASDAVAEGSESFTLRLDVPPGYGVKGSTTATGTIIDTSEPIVSIFGYTPSKFREGSTASLYVRLDAPTGADVTVDYAIVGGTADSDDYRDSPDAPSWPSGQARIPAGQTEVAIHMHLFDSEDVYEPEETFLVGISNPQGAVLGQTTALITIVDYGGAPTVSISDASAKEGERVDFTVTLSKLSAFETVVDYATADGSAVAGQHYTDRSGTVRIPAGVNSTRISVPTIEGSDLSGDRVFTVTLSDPVNAELRRSQATGRIIEDDCVDVFDSGDAAPVLSVAPASADEGEALSFRVMISEPFCTDVVEAVRLVASHRSTGSSDTNAPLETVLGFKAGETEAVFTGVRTLEDDLDESDETVAVTVSWHPSMPGRYTGSASATGSIIDDDDPPVLRVLDDTAAEGEGLVFVVALSSASAKTVAVDYTTNEVGSASANSDYTPVLAHVSDSGNPDALPSNRLVFAPGETEKQVLVQTLQDSLDEDDETFQLVLSGETNATMGDAIAAGVIEDNDLLPTASIANSSAVEDAGRLRFTITLDAPTGRTVTVVYTTADGTATAADDYTAFTGTATIAAGNKTTTIEIITTADTTAEPDETLTVQLLATSPNGTLQTTNALIDPDEHTATGTITNDD